ncbi:hypothetical protein BDY24DRAFT_406516 [Mrakia frigida]|uniref:uncharacterized protein n=1 Tax=Mrakia frigida TaxID=29902 RepID=UPI003FCC1368
MAITDGIVLKVINVLVFAFNLGSNVYSFTGTYGKETYLTPASYAFYVWSLIHLLLLGFVVYQFTETGKTLIIDKIEWRFALLGLLTTIYTWLGVRQYHILAFVASILVSAAVTAIYIQVKRNHRGGNLADELFVHLPFSLYHAWALVLVVLSGFEAFGREAHHHAGIGTKVFVFLALLFLETTAVGYAFQSNEGDIGGSAVITWTLWAIFEHQRSNAFIHWSALGFAILSSFFLLKALVLTWKSGKSGLHALHDEERAPLIPGSS